MVEAIRVKESSPDSRMTNQANSKLVQKDEHIRKLKAQIS